MWKFLLFLFCFFNVMILIYLITVSDIMQWDMRLDKWLWLSNEPICPVQKNERKSTKNVKQKSKKNILND